MIMAAKNRVRKGIFPLLKLPAELRIEIYKFAYTFKDGTLHPLLDQQKYRITNLTTVYALAHEVVDLEIDSFHNISRRRDYILNEWNGGGLTKAKNHICSLLLVNKEINAEASAEIPELSKEPFIVNKHVVEAMWRYRIVLKHLIPLCYFKRIRHVHFNCNADSMLKPVLIYSGRVLHRDGMYVDLLYQVEKISCEGVFDKPMLLDLTITDTVRHARF